MFGVLALPRHLNVVRSLLIAVATDFTKNGQDRWPVIKILPQPLKRARGVQLRLGERLATVALYSGTPDKPHWTDFSPIYTYTFIENAYSMAKKRFYDWIILSNGSIRLLRSRFDSSYRMIRLMKSAKLSIRV